MTDFILCLLTASFFTLAWALRTTLLPLTAAMRSYNAVSETEIEQREAAIKRLDELLKRIRGPWYADEGRN